MSGEGGPFLDELRRRKVVRVAAVYAAVGYAVVETADLVFPRLQLPDWTVTLVVIIALLGFPIALVFAWVFDLTDEGLKRTGAGADAYPADTGARWLSARAITAVALLVVLGVGAGWMAGRGAAGPARPRTRPSAPSPCSHSWT